MSLLKSLQLAAVLAFFGLVLLIASTEAQQSRNAARYDHYRLYRLHFNTTEQVAIFQELERVSDSVIFYGHARSVGQRLTILVSAHKIADITELLHRFAVEYSILNYNFQDAIDDQYRSARPRNTPGSEMNWKEYFHLDTIHAWLDTLIADYPDLVHPLDIGRSYEGRSLKGVRLSRAGRSDRPGIFIEAGIHAREWISPAASTFILNQLIHSPELQYLLDDFDWYFVPVVNPDGYTFTFEHDRMWRKTRQPNGLCLGTDMNRNFEINWNGTGSSPNACDYDFAGQAALSEPEAAAVTKWMRENRESARIETYIAMHSFSQLLMFPYAHTPEPVPNYDDLLAIGQKAVQALGRRYGTRYVTGSSYGTIYPSSGGSIHWAYKELNVRVAYTIELRGPPDSEVMFNLPAAQIEEVGWETLDGFVALLAEAKRLGYYSSGEQ